MRIISIVGARPQFIKLAPFSKAVREIAHEVIVHTGQHYDEKMSGLLFSDLKIPKPDYNLSIGSLAHGAQTGRMLEALEGVMINEKPNLVVIFGDTNSTLAGSLASAKLRIPVIHIEAGLRSFNRDMPEEINRIVADHTSDYLFAPTQTAVANLNNEGLKDKTFLTGDIMVDSLKDNLEVALEKSDVDKDLGISNTNFYLLTLHRPYNVDNQQNLQSIFKQLGSLDIRIVFPVHPRTRNIIQQSQLAVPANILLTEPLGYLDFIKLQWLSKKIITDSGGIQKEAYLLQRPCVTLRPETEWIETVNAGWNILLDYNQQGFTDKLKSFSPQGDPAPVFGDNVAKRMIEIIKTF